MRGNLRIFTCLLWSFFYGTQAFATNNTNQSCVKLHQVDVADSELLSKAEQDNLFQPYLGQCIDGKLLKALISDVSAFYMDRGDITTRAYLKSQNIQDGVIRISVMKGFVEDIVDADSHASNASIATAFAFQQGKILNLRDIETALEMVNRPSSVQASFAIKPGAKPGASVVEVKATHCQRKVEMSSFLPDRNVRFWLIDFRQG